MKTLNLIFATVTLAFVLTSCQKSSDLIAPTPAKKMAKSRELAITEMWSKFLPSINEPIAMPLGDERSFLQAGEKPVFYVLVSDMVGTDSFNGKLTLKDADSDLEFGTFDLVPSYDPSVADVNVPDELKALNLPFLFVRVTIPAESIDHAINLVADVNLATGENNLITLNRAFTVRN